MSTPRSSGVKRPLLWVTGSGVALLALWRSGEAREGLRLPGDPGHWQQWATRHDPLDVAAGVARSVALVLVGYLLLVAVMHLVAALLPRSGLRRLAEKATPRFLAGALAGGAGAGQYDDAGAVGRITATGGPTDGQHPPVMRLIDPTPPPDATTSTVVTTTQPSTTTSPTIAPTTTATTTTARKTTAPQTTAPPSKGRHTTAPSSAATPLDAIRPLTAPTTAAAVPAATTAPSPTEESTVTEHVVRPDEHLWSIAEQTVTSLVPAPPTDAEVATFWRRLIAANHERLVDPTDPSLILPGQRLVLPD